MMSQLKTQYLTYVIPAALLAGMAQCARAWGMMPAGFSPIPPWGHQGIFILAAVTALAGPLFARTWFAHTLRQCKKVEADQFLGFQKAILRIALVTPYLAAAALALGFPKFYTSGILLLALYAVYYYYPSEQRIQFDQKVFRVC